MARLGDFIEQIRGVSYKPDDLHDTLNENSVILLRANNIRDGKLNFDDVVYVDKKKVKDNQYLKSGDILVCASSGSKELVGKAAFVGKNLPMAFGAFCKVVRPQVNCPKYIGHFFDSPYYRKRISNASAGVNINNIRNEHIDEFEIQFPSLSCQKHIATVLDKVSDLIALRKQQLAKLDELVKARFIEMFGDITDTVPLSYYITDLSAGKSLAGEEECPNKVLKTGAATYDYFDPTQVKNLPTDYEPLEDHRVKTGDVIISRMNTAELVGAAAYVWEAPERTYLPDRLWRAEIKETVYPVFLWQVLIQSSTKESIRRIASGTSGSMKNISKPGLLGIRVKKVPLVLQEQFAAFVEQTDKSKLTVQQSLYKLKTLKEALMQKYFG